MTWALPINPSKYRAEWFAEWFGQYPGVRRMVCTVSKRPQNGLQYPGVHRIDYTVSERSQIGLRSIEASAE